MNNSVEKWVFVVFIILSHFEVAVCDGSVELGQVDIQVGKDGSLMQKSTDENRHSRLHKFAITLVFTIEGREKKLGANFTAAELLLWSFL